MEDHMKVDPGNTLIDRERFREVIDKATRDPQERTRANFVKKATVQFLGEPKTFI